MLQRTLVQQIFWWMNTLAHMLVYLQSPTFYVWEILCIFKNLEGDSWRHKTPPQPIIYMS